MTQLSYDYDMPVGMQGAIAQSGPRNILTFCASEDIPFGAGVVRRLDDDLLVRLAETTEATITFDGDLQPGNQISMLVNGVPIAQVTYATSHVATMGALKDAVMALSDSVASATIGGQGSRELLVKSIDDKDIAISYFTLSGGSSRPVALVEQDSSDNFVGVALLTETIEQDRKGKACYRKGYPVNVMTRGFVWVPIEEDVRPSSPVMLRNQKGTQEGQDVGNFRTSDPENVCINADGARWAMFCKGPGLGMLELNMP